jgi:hypothetical protein
MDIKFTVVELCASRLAVQVLGILQLGDAPISHTPGHVSDAHVLLLVLLGRLPPHRADITVVDIGERTGIVFMFFSLFVLFLRLHTWRARHSQPLFATRTCVFL